MASQYFGDEFRYYQDYVNTFWGGQLLPPDMRQFLESRGKALDVQESRMREKALERLHLGGSAYSPAGASFVSTFVDEPMAQARAQLDADTARLREQRRDVAMGWAEKKAAQKAEQRMGMGKAVGKLLGTGTGIALGLATKLSPQAAGASMGLDIVKKLFPSLSKQEQITGDSLADAIHGMRPDVKDKLQGIDLSKVTSLEDLKKLLEGLETSDDGGTLWDLFGAFGGGN